MAHPQVGRKKLQRDALGPDLHAQVELCQTRNRKLIRARE